MIFRNSFDQEDFLGGELEDVYDSTQFPSQPLAQDFGEIETIDDYMYIPQSYEPQIFHPSTGAAPPNLSPQHYLNELPYYMMDMVDYPDPNAFDLLSVVPSSQPQQQVHSRYTEPQLFAEPHPEPIPTLPAAPLEFNDFRMSDFPNGPPRRLRTPSHTGDPSMPSPLITTGVVTYSHTPTVPLNRASQSPGFAGPGSMTGSRQSPISPQKRSLENDDSLAGRRVIPRQAGSSNVHSAITGGTDITTPSITSRVPGRGPTIPQALYNVGNTHSFHFDSNNTAIVTFDVSGETGIPLHQLLDRQSYLLQERDERIPMSGDTASIRIEWPGYPSFCKQIASKDWKKTREHNTRGRLAMKVAGAVYAFLQKHANTTCDPPNSTWRIGADGIHAEDIVLVSLHRVSRGSWQPKLCLIHDNA